jgi:hypothetical protein
MSASDRYFQIVFSPKVFNKEYAKKVAKIVQTCLAPFSLDDDFYFGYSDRNCGVSSGTRIKFDEDIFEE